MAPALIVGLLSVVTALALPFAAVSVNQPQVSWPADPVRPASTMLMLSAYRPLAFDASFSCADVRAAAATGGSLVLATTRAGSAEGAGAGLVVAMANGELTVTSRGVGLAREPIGADSCRYTLAGQDGSMVLARDGRELGRGPMPDVDALVTTVATAPGASTTDLSVRLTVDDRFATSPAPGKVALIVLLLVAVAGAVGLLVAFGRRVGGVRSDRADVTRPARPWGAAVDVLVVAALGMWLFLAPLTIDDGYYSAMAANAPFEGYVGNYFQLFNQGFTPFSWIYWALASWQNLVGFSPVALRVPAVVCGLLTWVCVRGLVGTVRSDPQTAAEAAGARRRVLTTAALGVVFLAWWLPFDMGLRPETVVALAVVASLLCLVRAVERGSLLLVGTAVGISSLGATASPSGLVALAPLVAALPAVWPLLRRDDGPFATSGRILCVLAPGAAGALAAFGDGSWRDFVRAQELLRGVKTESWYTEYLRWQSLFESGSSTYAHRAPVLVTALAVAGLLVLWAVGRALSRPLPDRLLITGTTTALAFLLLAPTPSKPWMHYGTMAGVGAVFVALMVVDGPSTMRRLAGGRRPPRAGVLAAVVVVVSTLAVAGHGVNTWVPVQWTPALPHPDTPPQVWIFRFDQPLWWLLGVLVVAGVVRVVAKRRSPAWMPYATVVALSAIVALFLAANTAYLFATFGLQAVRTLDSWSIPAQNLRDPAATECGAGSQVEAADPAGPPLLPDPRAPAAPQPGPGFLADAGWPASSPPPVPPVARPNVTAWGSLAGDPERPEARPEERVGRLVTPVVHRPAGTDPTERSPRWSRAGPATAHP